MAFLLVLQAHPWNLESLGKTSEGAACDVGFLQALRRSDVSCPFHLLQLRRVRLHRRFGVRPRLGLRELGRVFLLEPVLDDLDSLSCVFLSVLVSGGNGLRPHCCVRMISHFSRSKDNIYKR